MSNKTFNRFLIDLAEGSMSYMRYIGLMSIATDFQREFVGRWIELNAE